MFRWHANDDTTLNAVFVIFKGIQTSIARKPYIFVIFERRVQKFSVNHIMF